LDDPLTESRDGWQSHDRRNDKVLSSFTALKVLLMMVVTVPDPVCLVLQKKKIITYLSIEETAGLPSGKTQKLHI
jgi:hypothetical protein